MGVVVGRIVVGGERGADGTHFLVRFVITADDKVISW